MSENLEPKEAFPYSPPTEEVRLKYQHIFDIDKPLSSRFFKLLFDKVVAFFLLVLAAPILLLLKICYVIEGILVPENAGPMLFYYNAVSAGKIIPKYKIRLIKTKFIDLEGAKRHDWIAYSAEWNSDSRTIMGQIVKRFYLDELPQFWSVLKGDMSIVGPRPMVPKTYAKYTKEAQTTLNTIRPGLTGIGSIFFRDEEKFLIDKDDPMAFYEEYIIPYKSDLEVWYVKNNSITLYVQIILITAWVVIFSKSKIAEKIFNEIPKRPKVLL